MNKLIKATICVGLGVAFLGGFSSEAKFSNVDSATIDFKNGSIINVGVTPLRCHFQHYFFAKK